MHNADLLRQSNRAGVQFLLTDIDTGLTFLAVAETTSVPESRARSLNFAREAYVLVRRLLPRVEPTPEERETLQRKMSELRDGLSAAGYCAESNSFAAP